MQPALPQEPSSCLRDGNSPAGSCIHDRNFASIRPAVPAPPIRSLSPTTRVKADSLMPMIPYATSALLGVNITQYAGELKTLFAMSKLNLDRPDRRPKRFGNRIAAITHSGPHVRFPIRDASSGRLTGAVPNNRSQHLVNSLRGYAKAQARTPYSRPLFAALRAKVIPS